MTLLIMLAAACIAALVWYISPKAKQMKLGTLALAYWGAALMWTVDAVVEYLEIGAVFFSPSAADMLNDAFLGFSAVVLGLAVWVGSLVVKAITLKGHSIAHE